MGAQLSGVFPIVATPFRDDGTADAGDLRRVVDFIVGAGADGVVFPGVASGFETLAPGKRRELTAAVAEAVAGRVPLVVGVSAPDAAAARAHAAQARGVSARVQSWFWFALAAATVALVLFPIYWMIVTSLLPSSIVLSRNPPLLPPLDHVSLDAFAGVFRRRPVLTWILNSTLVAVGSTIVSLVIATLAGYSLSRWQTRAQKVAGAALLLTKMLPGSLIAVPFFVMFTTAHLIDTRAALVAANVTVGLQSFVGEYLVDWPALMAAGVVSLAPMLVLFLLLEPFLVSGLRSGAVKQ